MSTYAIAAVGGAAASVLLCGRGASSGDAPSAPSAGFDPVCEAACQGLDVIPAAEGSGDGTIEKLGDMDCYVVGSGDRAILLIYDIFGFSPANTRHNCDVLAKAGFLVIMPDLFRGSGRRSEGFVRPQNDAVDSEILDTVVPFVKSKGAKTIGVLGFCFGGGAAMRLASADVFAACAGIHASGMASPDGEAFVSKALCPIMLLQAGGDPSLTPVYETVQKMKSIKDDSVLRTFWDQRHGWCGATGNRTGDPKLKAAVESALTSIIKFFSRTLVTPVPQYTLHLYDHCPFCVKVELVMGLLDVGYDRKVWGYGEGAKPVGEYEGSSVGGPAMLMNEGETEGTKGLPILEISAKRQYAKDWKSASPYQRESSDIIVLMNQLSGCKLSAKTGLGMDWKKSASALGQLTTVHKFKAPLNMAGDYQHAEDAAYGQQKYVTKGGGKYLMKTVTDGDKSTTSMETVADEATLIKEANLSLAAFDKDVLPSLLAAHGAASADGLPGLDDIELLPTLRNATCIPGLEWPAGTKKYVEDICAKAKVATYF